MIWPLASVFPYLPRPVVDAACRLSRASSLVGLTRISGHADSAVPVVTLVTGTEVLVWTGVDTGGLGMTNPLETRVYGCGDRGGHTRIFNVLCGAQCGVLQASKLTPLLHAVQ